MQTDPGELLADTEVLQCQLDPSLQVDHVDRGYGDGELYRPKPLELVARLARRSDASGDSNSVDAPPEGP